MSTASGDHAAPLFRERVDLPDRPTDVLLGSGLRDALADEIRARFPDARRIGVVVDATVHSLWPLDVSRLGMDVLRFVAPAGESSKRRDVLGEMQDTLLDLRREEPVVVIGGGAVLDAGGFAAATVRRGLPWVAVPTTVLAMADASVGGKVAVNHPRGKNLLGTFHPPTAVLADVDYLSTLDARDRAAGLAEVYKVGRIRDPALVERLEDGPPDDRDTWIEILGRAVTVKARLVEEDERDFGARRLLNYGHTVGHALERLLPNEEMRHGEGVAIGMAVAARLARARDLVAAEMPERQERSLAALGLPVRLPPGMAVDEVLEAMDLDKKRRPGDPHTFVLPCGDAGAAVVEDVSDEEVLAVLAAVNS